jgi:hypothetical protein
LICVPVSTAFNCACHKLRDFANRVSNFGKFPSMKAFFRVLGAEEAFQAGSKL